MAPKAGEAATQGAPVGRKPHCPNSPWGPEDDEIQVVKVQKGGLTLPARVKERQYDRMNNGGRQSLYWPERGGWSSKG